MKKKMMSLVLAMAMILSALPAASAVSADPLSEYAGQTIQVLAVDDTGDNTVSRIVEVTIPAGATETEALTLIHATAFWTDTVSPLSLNDSVTYLGEVKNFSLYPNPRQFWSRTLPSTLNEIYFTFNMDYLTTDGVVQVQLTNNNYSNPTLWVAASASTLPALDSIREVVFRVSAIPMNAGDTITAYAKCNTSADVNYCNVTGYYR